MKIVISQPATIYYAWQTEVLLNNLLDIKFNLNDVEIVCSGIRTNEWSKLAFRYAARFFFYASDAVTHKNNSKLTYPSISRPNVLKKHFKKYPELSNEKILYIDCDILFLSNPTIFLDVFSNDSINYISDCKWYIGYSYFKSKEKQSNKLNDKVGSLNIDDELKELCKQINLAFDKIVENDDHSGGAQYFLKNIDWQFWEEVENDCDTIYNFFHYHSSNSLNRRYFKSENEGIQSFCADMWAVLWNLWKRDKNTRVIKEMNFAWPGYSYSDKNKFNILHNAGVIEDKELFHKVKYVNRIPFYDDFSNKDKTRLSYYYIEQLIKLKDKTCL